MSEGLDIPVGYIPAGSTNDFAASLGISTDNLQAARDIVNGHTRPVDMGIFGQRYFSYVASFGAFTRASYATPQSLKNVLGHAAYVLSGIAEIGQIKAEEVTIELPDGKIIEGPFLFGTISNSTSVGGILTLAPGRVDMSDGKLEVMLVRAPKNLNEVGEIIAAMQNQSYNCNAMTFLSVDRLKLTAKETMAWTLDGEQQGGASSVEVRCLKHAVRVYLPKPAAVEASQ